MVIALLLLLEEENEHFEKFIAENIKKISLNKYDTVEIVYILSELEFTEKGKEESYSIDRIRDIIKNCEEIEKREGIKTMLIIANYLKDSYTFLIAELTNLRYLICSKSYLEKYTQLSIKQFLFNNGEEVDIYQNVLELDFESGLDLFPIIQEYINSGEYTIIKNKYMVLENTFQSIKFNTAIYGRIIEIIINFFKIYNQKFTFQMILCAIDKYEQEQEQITSNSLPKDTDDQIIKWFEKPSLIMSTVPDKLSQNYFLLLNYKYKTYIFDLYNKTLYGIDYISKVKDKFFILKQKLNINTLLDFRIVVSFKRNGKLWNNSGNFCVNGKKVRIL